MLSTIESVCDVEKLHNLKYGHQEQCRDCALSYLLTNDLEGNFRSVRC